MSEIYGYQLFDDVAEQEHVFALLDELAGQPNQRAAIKFSSQDSLLIKRIILLSITIHNYEKEHKFDANKISYQRALVNYLWDKLESNDRADKLGAALPEIKELLLKAWAISLEMLCGRMKPLVDTAKKLSTGGKKGHENAYGNQNKKTAARVQWQGWVDDAVARNSNSSFEQIKSIVIKNHHGEVSASQLKRYTKDPRKIKLVQ